MIYFSISRKTNPASTRIPGYLQTELIHGVDLVQIIHDEVKQGRPDSYGTIVLPGFVYLHLINFSFQHLRMEDPRLKIKRKEMSDVSSGYLQLNLSCCVFGGLQFLHQQVVTQEVALSRREPGQELIFQKLELNLEHVLLFGQLALHRFKSVLLGKENRKLPYHGEKEDLNYSP